MNVIDWVIIGIIGVSVLFGLYRGFVASVASMGSGLVSLGGSYFLTPKLADMCRQNTGLMDTLRSYTGAATRLQDSVLAGETYSQGKIGEVMNKVSLPAPLDSLLKNNLDSALYGTEKKIGYYVSETIVSAVLNIMCFIVSFIGLMIAFHIIIAILKAIFKFPVLKQMNSVAGGLFGLLRGLLLCFVAFALLPLFETVIPGNTLTDLVNGSLLAPVFNNGSLILSIMRGHL